MSQSVRIQLSVGLLVVAAIHAVLLVGLLRSVPPGGCECPASPISWSPWSYGPPTPSVGTVEKLDEPQHVNLQAQGEMKQQGRVVCPPGYTPSRVVVHPTIVQPSQVRPTIVTPRAPVFVPPPATPVATPVAPPVKKSYQIALFIGSDAKSRQLLDWFNRDTKLYNLRNACEFQVYTASDPLYVSRFAQIVPVEQFPVVLFQDASGGHVHAAGRTMIPTTASELYDDLRQGYELYKQVKHAEKTGAVRTRGYSWDAAISPTMQLTQQDCPDGYCPVTPSDPWRPGDRVRDLLFDEVRDTRDAFLWASAGELATIALSVVAVILIGFILIKRGF